MRPHPHVFSESRQLDPLPIGHLIGAGSNIGGIDRPNEHVIVLVLDHVRSYRDMIRFPEGRRQGTVKPHLLVEAAPGLLERDLTGSGMTATSIGPEPP